MKFLDGDWLVRQGFTVKYAASIYDSRIETDAEGRPRLLLWVSYGQPISYPGMTLAGGILTIEVSSPREDVITTKLINFRQSHAHDPQFKLNLSQPAVSIVEEADAFIVSSGRTALRIAKGQPIDFTYSFDGQVIAHSGGRAKALITDAGGQIHLGDQFDLAVNEKIYGLGERFTAFVKNGQSVDIWQEDGGTGTQQAYKNIPFYLSSKKYGLFVNSTGRVSYEIGSEKVSRVEVSVPGQELEYSVIGGASPKAILDTYTDLTGKPPVPPAWSFGLWLSTSFTTDYDEQTVTQFVDGMAERDIPLSVFHFDCRWMKELEWCNFQWDPAKFPNPTGLLDSLHAKGLKVCVWINPYIGQKSPLFAEGAAAGYFIKTTDGQAWQWDQWQAGMAVVDFTNPAAVAWYQGKLRTLLHQGVDCFKTDFGERIPTEGVTYFDGSDPVLMHNYYTRLYNQAVYDVIAEVKGADEAVVFARSATVGSQSFPVHWGGDSSSNYPSMAESLRAGLSFGLSGFGFWSHDISGFEDEASPDLYKRWTQFGLLSSHSRYHGSTQYKVPWLYGEEAVEVTREFTRLKLRLLPYLLNAAAQAHQHGTPVMRPLVLEFPDDPAAENIDTQYMLGPDLLVAPVFSESGRVRFYVPNSFDEAGQPVAGRWTNLLTGQTYEPGRWYQQTFDYHSLPLLVRPGAILPLGLASVRSTDYDYAKQVELLGFQLADGEHEVRLPDAHAELAALVRVRISAGAAQSDRGLAVLLDQPVGGLR